MFLIFHSRLLLHRAGLITQSKYGMLCVENACLTIILTGVHFNRDGTLIVSGIYDGTIRIWDSSTGQQLKCFHNNSVPVSFVQFSPNCKYILSGSFDNTWRLWTCNDGKCLRAYTGTRTVHFVVLQPFLFPAESGLSVEVKTTKSTLEFAKQNRLFKRWKDTLTV